MLFKSEPFSSVKERKLVTKKFAQQVSKGLGVEVTVRMLVGYKQFYLDNEHGSFPVSSSIGDVDWRLSHGETMHIEANLEVNHEAKK